MPQDRTPQLSFNLSRRLISIFLVSVLAVYTAGITVTLRLRRSAMQDWQAAAHPHPDEIYPDPFCHPAADPYSAAGQLSRAV